MASIWNCDFARPTNPEKDYGNLGSVYGPIKRPNSPSSTPNRSRNNSESSASSQDSSSTWSFSFKRPFALVPLEDKKEKKRAKINYVDAGSFFWGSEDYYYYNF